MAVIHCDFVSETLGMSVRMNVLLPQATQKARELSGKPLTGPHPTLWLLHGLAGDHTAWVRRTNIERYAERLGLAVVMPNVHRSFYTDMHLGGNYWTYLSEELPRVARSFLPSLSESREDNFVVGHSMGGYGAFKLAMAQPDRFAAAASLSGALDLLGLIEHAEQRDLETHLIFGDAEQFVGSDNDLRHLAQRLAEKGDSRPEFYLGCGADDEMLLNNRGYAEHLRSVGLDPVFEVEPGGHDWDYWDRAIQRVLDWLPLDAAAKDTRAA